MSSSQARSAALRRVVDAITTELFGGDLPGLDPMRETGALASLQRACFEDPAGWARVAEALTAETEGGASPRARQAVTALQSLADELAQSAAAGAPPSPAGWAELVEFAAAALAAEDLERDDSRQTRLTEGFRGRLRALRRQRAPQDWSWEALTASE